MTLLQKFIETARRSPAAIAYPEGAAPRILNAASKARTLGIAHPILVGDTDLIRKSADTEGISIEGMSVASPLDPDRIEKYAAAYSAARNVPLPLARKVVRKPLCFAGMMVKTGDADGMVGGSENTTAAVISAASLTVGLAQGCSTVSSFFIMVAPGFLGRQDVPFVFADCAVNIAPTPRQLADIAISSAASAESLLGIKPKVAFLSFSTKGSASHTSVDRVVEALKIARESRADIEMDGELQGDAAIVPSIGAKKAKGSTVAGSANVLVFPDLNAGNICYKLVQHLGGAQALGPILQGFAKPVCDLSRGAVADDIVGVTAVAAILADRARKGACPNP